MLMIPFLLLIHPIFAIFGLQGTIRPEDRNQISLKLDIDSFRRRR